jgi:hypothetical protein
MLTSKLVRNATLKIYTGAPHGMCTTWKDEVNAELLTFIKIAPRQGCMHVWSPVSGWRGRISSPAAVGRLGRLSDGNFCQTRATLYQRNLGRRLSHRRKLQTASTNGRPDVARIKVDLCDCTRCSISSPGWCKPSRSRCSCKPLAATQPRPPMLVSQLIVMAILVVLGIGSAHQFHPESRGRCKFMQAA